MMDSRNDEKLTGGGGSNEKKISGAKPESAQEKTR